MIIPPKIKAKVVLVRDGDSFDSIEIANPTRKDRCRNIAIDTPEYPFKQYQLEARNPKIKCHFRWGVVAKEFVKTILNKYDNIVYLQFYARDNHDKRQVVDIWLPDGKNLNELLLRNGLARIWFNDIQEYHTHFYLLSPKKQKRWLNIQQHAIKNQKGLWGDSEFKWLN